MRLSLIPLAILAIGFAVMILLRAFLTLTGEI